MSEFPHKISVRDAACNDDLGGLGQRIYTTAGQGYTKQEYIRADIWADLLREIDRLRAENEALKERLAYFEAITTGAEHVVIDAALRREKDKADMRALVEKYKRGEGG